MSTIKDDYLLKINQIYPYAFAAILIGALILRLLGLDKGIWLDEYFSLRWNEIDNLGNLIIKLRDYDKPPLYFTLLYLWTRISENEQFCRLFSIVFDIGTIVILMKWIKQYSALGSILGGLYFSTLPIILRYSQEIRPYSLLILATALAFFFASRIVAKPEKISGYGGVALSLALAVSTHLVGIMLIIPITIFIVLMARIQKAKFDWTKLILALTLPSLVFIFFYVFYLNTLAKRVAEWWMPSISWTLLSTTTQYVLGLSNIFFQSYINAIIVFIFFALLSIAVIFGQWKNNYPFFLAALIFWLEVIIYSWIKTPIFYYRIIVPGLIPFIGFLALQITSIEVKSIKKIAILLLILLTFIFTWNWTTFQAYQPVEYDKQVANSIKSEWQPNSLVFFYPRYSAGIVQYYFQELPQEARILVRNTQETDPIKLEINKKLTAMGKNKLKEVIIVTRSNFSDETNTYNNILLAIKSEIKSQVKLKIFLILSHDLFFVNDWDKPNRFFKVLSSELGQPLSIQDEKVYRLSEYEL